jgi:hypothetical protein
MRVNILEDNASLWARQERLEALRRHLLERPHGHDDELLGSCHRTLGFIEQRLYERDERQRCEVEMVDCGLKAYVQVGRALRTIRAKRLYRETHATFEDYCRERWGLSTRRAYELIRYAEMLEMLPMAKLAPLRHEPARLVKAWQPASAATGGNP